MTTGNTLPNSVYFFTPDQLEQLRLAILLHTFLSRRQLLDGTITSRITPSLAGGGMIESTKKAGKQASASTITDEKKKGGDLSVREKV